MRAWIIPFHALRFRLIPILLAPLSLLAFLPYFLDSSNVLIFRDLAETDLPAKKIWLESVTSFGNIPLWNHLQGGGSPILEDLVSGPLYPLNAIYLLFGKSQLLDGLVFFLMAHYLLIYFGFFLLARTLGLSRSIAVLVGLMGALNGYSVSAFNLTHVLAGITALPWFGFFWARFLLKARWYDLLGSSIAVAWPIYGGDPQPTYVLAVASLVYGFYVAGFSRALLAWSLMGVSALLVAGPQLAPAFSLFLESTRFSSDNAPTSSSIGWALHPSRLIEILIPNFFGFFTNPAEFLAGWQTRRNHKGFFINSLYIGALPGMCLVWYFLSGRAFRKNCQRRSSFLAIIIVLSFLLTMGAWVKPDIYAALGRFLPLWSSFRYPERLAFVPLFLMILLSGFALRAMIAALVLSGRGTKTARLFVLLPIFYLLVFLLGFWSLRAMGGKNSALIGEAAILMLCVAVLFLLRQKKRYFLPMLLIAILGGFFRSFPGAIEFQHRDMAQPDSYLSTKKILADLEKRKIDRLTGAPDRLLTLARSFAPISKSEYLDKSLSDFERKEFMRWESFSGNIPSFFGIPSVQGHYSLEIGFKNKLILHFIEKDYSHLINLMGARYLLSRDGGNPTEVKVNLDALENFRFFDQFDSASNEEEEFKKIAANLDIKRKLTLFGTFGEKNLAPVQNLRVNLAKQDNRSATFEISSKEDGKTLFLFNSTWMPGWKAYWLGREIPIFRANGWAKAVFLDGLKAEPQSLVFRYNDKSGRIGLMMGLTWILLAVMLGVFRNRLVHLVGDQKIRTPDSNMLG
jgi:hypothetical protein